jgi:hypothetical protein
MMSMIDDLGRDAPPIVMRRTAVLEDGTLIVEMDECDLERVGRIFLSSGIWYREFYEDDEDE